MERKDDERKKRLYEALLDCGEETWKRKMRKERKGCMKHQTGNVSLLKQLMAKDPLTLARAAVTCFNETPLHVATMLGHLDFTNSLLTKKPDMTMAVDSRGRSPLHLASANGYVEMVNTLLSAKCLSYSG